MLADLSSRIQKSSWFQYLLPFELPPLLNPDPAPPGDQVEHGQKPRLEFGWGVISAICPPELVDRVIDECGRREQRWRLLPARLTVYALLLMCLYPALGYQRLMHQLQEGARSAHGWCVPNRSSFQRARDRLGVEVMERLFRALAGPLADAHAEGCWWRGRRVMAIDGSTVEVTANSRLEAAYGGSKVEGGVRRGAPKVRVVGLIECGTRALADLTWGHFEEGEVTQVRRLLPSIEPGMLVIGDANFRGVSLWNGFLGAGADLLWRVDRFRATKVIQRLADNTYLARILSAQGEKVVVRVIEYRVPGSKEVYRLVTNLLDPQQAPALELAALYAERWEIELLFRELKVLQCAVGSLRSQTPGGVEQELWAHGVAYQISRRLAYQAAMQTPDRNCDRISFTAVQDALRAGVRMLGGNAGRSLRWAIGQLTDTRRLLTRRNRVCPRVVAYGWHKYPSRATYQGPTSERRPRRPALVLCP